MLKVVIIDARNVCEIYSKEASKILEQHCIVMSQASDTYCFSGFSINSDLFWLLKIYFYKLLRVGNGTLKMSKLLQEKRNLSLVDK